MRDRAALEERLSGIDGSGYRSYRELKGAWDLGAFTLMVDHAQGDPFAAPSRVRALLTPSQSELPAEFCAPAPRGLGVAAHLARCFAADARARTGPRASDHDARSSAQGRSGEVRMEHPGQIVALQTAVLVSGDGAIEARFTAGLPGRGRRVDGRAARTLLLETIPDLVADTLVATAYREGVLEEAALVNEDAEALRGLLADHRLVTFVADGSRLARRSGDDDRPLETDSVPFLSPDSMRVVLEAPNAGPLPGLGIGEGVTLITGGGFHGKSTVLRAIQDGVWNHAPGDGRERVVTIMECAKVRAEDGRPVTAVDISSFIGALPNGDDTRRFTTSNASGSTSQASAIMESIEAGARALLIDEDTSATNFMIRDRRMQTLVPPEAEPITPFVDRVRSLHEDLGVSSVLVLGGSGDYLDPADRVIRMTGYQPADVTEEAARIAAALPTGRAQEGVEPLTRGRPRSMRVASLDASKGRRSVHVRVPDERTLLFGTRTIDLIAVEQLARRSQIRAAGLALAWFGRTHPAASFSPAELIETIMAALGQDGLDTFEERIVGDLTAFRALDVMAVLNRLREVRVD